MLGKAIYKYPLETYIKTNSAKAKAGKRKHGSIMSNASVFLLILQPDLRYSQSEASDVTEAGGFKSDKMRSNATYEGILERNRRRPTL